MYPLIHFPCVQKILAQGYAYPLNGTVYFDTAAFGKRYGKLAPTRAESKSQNLVKEPSSEWVGKNRLIDRSIG